jgi:ABC-type multidrug transport system, ATPase and permease components
MNNIRISKKDATDEEMITADKAANRDGFISKMSAGYETTIGENGCTFSGAGGRFKGRY